MYRNAFRIHKLIKDILDVTRIEGQTLNLDKIRFNLKDLIKSLVDDIQPKLVADSNNNKVKVVLESLEHRGGEVENNIDTVFVLADRDRIAQVISNLLDNALRHTPEGGAVQVTTLATPGEVQVEVCDTGEGISDEDLPRVFERFYRVEKSRSRATGGAGLGLAIAAGIVEAHGGQIGAESAVGQGTRVWFTLPR